MDTGPWAPNIKNWTLANTRHWTLRNEYWELGTEYWTQVQFKFLNSAHTSVTLELLGQGKCFA